MINQTTCKGLCDVPCACSGRLALDPHDIAFAGGVLPDKIVLEDDDVEFISPPKNSWFPDEDDFLAGKTCGVDAHSDCESCS